jgi:hypothetical protein
MEKLTLEKLQITTCVLVLFFKESGFVGNDSYSKFDTDTSPPR